MAQSEPFPERVSQSPPIDEMAMLVDRVSETQPSDATAVLVDRVPETQPSDAQPAAGDVLNVPTARAQIVKYLEEFAKMNTSGFTSEALKKPDYLADRLLPSDPLEALQQPSLAWLESLSKTDGSRAQGFYVGVLRRDEDVCLYVGPAKGIAGFNSRINQHRSARRRARGKTIHYQRIQEGYAAEYYILAQAMNLNSVEMLILEALLICLLGTYSNHRLKLPLVAGVLKGLNRTTALYDPISGFDVMADPSELQAAFTHYRSTIANHLNQVMQARKVEELLSDVGREVAVNLSENKFILFGNFVLLPKRQFQRLVSPADLTDPAQTSIKMRI